MKLELRSISEEERVKSGLARAKLGGLSKAEIMEMVIIIIITRTLREKKNILKTKLGGLFKADIMEMVTIPILNFNALCNTAHTQS